MKQSMLSLLRHCWLALLCFVPTAWGSVPDTKPACLPSWGSGKVLKLSDRKNETAETQLGIPPGITCPLGLGAHKDSEGLYRVYRDYINCT